MHPQRECDILENVQVGKQGTALEQHAHLLARIEQVAARERRQVLPRHPDFAAIGPQLRAHQAQ
ncbi:hypothetical protein D3C87_1962690 [compost metagenome]